MKAVKSSFEKELKKRLKQIVLKNHPELEGKDLEVEYKYGFECPDCGTNGRNGLFFRVDGGEWQPNGELACYECANRELARTLSRVSFPDNLKERLEKEYFLIPDNLKDAGFKNYEVLDSVTGKAKEQSMDYVKKFLAGERFNLFMKGNPGTGKSHLCAAIARTIKAKDYIVGYVTTGEILRKIRATYTAGASKTEEGIFKDLKRFDLLVLDDLGSESIGGNDDWRKGMLFEIVNSRLGKPTIYTSNLDDPELPTAIGSRVHSRLYDNTKFIDLFTDDYRKKLKIG